MYIAHKGHLNVKKIVSRRGSTQKLSPIRTQQLRQGAGDISDPESRQPTEINIPFKQQFWRVPIINESHSSHGSAQSHDQVLKACSVKLAELKKRHKSKKDKVEQDLAGLPLRQPVKRKQKQRRTKSLRYESSGNYQIENSGLLKIKPFKSTDQKKVISETVNKNAKKIPNKKFRKGGIVSLATVNSHRTRVESASGDDSLENAGNKKKKKKRKILQIQKHIKTAVTAVAAVTISKKESNKNLSRKKN
ncbi:hypothetical protein O3M35_006327 [Rhynocoris fuscipes]|uniref:Uncharacterized protein n=1 Tax=Rhynocoris fuscipes TaxID=488301 RepID=A0AAW1DIV6_9HEMI